MLWWAPLTDLPERGALGEMLSCRRGAGGRPCICAQKGCGLGCSPLQRAGGCTPHLTSPQTAGTHTCGDPRALGWKGMQGPHVRGRRHGDSTSGAPGREWGLIHHHCSPGHRGQGRPGGCREGALGIVSARACSDSCSERAVGRGQDPLCSGTPRLGVRSPPNARW